MDVLKSIPAPGMPDGHTLEIGHSSWGDGIDISVRMRYQNRNGGFSHQSPEVPLKMLVPMMALGES